ncbi:hypothetical protein [Helicobacter pylori]|nr:hypothetical protein [Helicobacter pylori]
MDLKNLENALNNGEAGNALKTQLISELTEAKDNLAQAIRPQ